MKSRYPKLFFFLVLLTLFVLSVTIGQSQKSENTPKTTNSDAINAVFAPTSTESTDVPGTHPTESAPTSTAPHATRAPLVIETLTPDAPLVSALLDTPPVAPSTEAPLPPILVTGLPDTPPIDLPLTLPMEADEPIAAAYIATAYRLDFPKSKVLTKEALTSEIETAVKNAKEAGLNTLFFQVRPASDAFYHSSIFPSSRYLVKNEGDAPPIDVLAEFVKAAHREGISLYAWVNPYRITSKSESLSSLSPHNPAKTHSEYTFEVNGAWYYQPALSEVQTLVVDGIREIVENYAVDGILFDDYFYPEGMTNEDSTLYQEYRSGGGTLTLFDWRRENVNLLIESCYRAIKKIRPDCAFGVAPRGIWRNASEDPLGSMTEGGSAYDSIFCDALAWVRKGTVDFLAPQLYSSYHEEKAEFIALALWWQNALKNRGIAFIPSLAAYRLSEEEIRAQIFFLSSLQGYKGFALYRMEYV